MNPTAATTSGAALVILLATALPAFPQQTKATDLPSPKMRVAVMDLSGKALQFSTSYTPTSSETSVELPPPDGFARGLTEMLTTALSQEGDFVVLERSEIQDVLDEQDFGDSGRVNRETAPALGKVIGAQALITGDITEFTYQKSSVGGNMSVLGGVNAGVDRLTAMVALDVRVVDAVTGEVLFSTRQEGHASATGANLDVDVKNQQVGTGFTRATPLGKASREAIGKIVDAVAARLASAPWEGRIVDVRGGTIYLNAGAKAGIRQGMVFDVYAESEPLVDPETGQTLGTPEKHVGTIRVDAVQDKYATAHALGGGAMSRDMVVKFRGEGASP